MRAIFHWWYIYLETRLIDGILDWKRGRMGNRPLINLVSRRSWLAVYSQWTKKWRSRPSEDEVAEFQAKTAQNKCKNKQNISLDGSYLLFRCIRKEKHLFTSSNRAEKYATILRWRKLVKNGEIFRMNNKTIIEFGFRMMWRIMQISEDAIHLGLQLRWITSFSSCIILHIVRKPNSIIAK